MTSTPIVALLLLSFLVMESSSVRAAGEFAGFAGYRRGKGQISLDSGPEDIRCRATYAIRSDDNALNVDMTCASDSYRVHIKTYFVPQGAGFGGTWQETTRQVQGQVTGRFNGPGQITANLEALGVQLSLTAGVAANRQAISLRSDGGGFEGANITLVRR